MGAQCSESSRSPAIRRQPVPIPAIVAFSEHAFLARTDTPIDPLFFATAHEIAHQWWGGRCVGARRTRIAIQ